jgi:hypothetical protein
MKQAIAKVQVSQILLLAKAAQSLPLGDELTLIIESWFNGNLPRHGVKLGAKDGDESLVEIYCDEVLFDV